MNSVFGMPSVQISYKKKLTILVILIFIVAGLLVAFRYFPTSIDTFLLAPIGSEKFPSVTVNNNSSQFHISIREKAFFQLIKDQTLQSGIRHIVIETTDTIQENRNSWGSEPFSSITIKNENDTRKIIIQIDQQIMKNAGWSERMISQELESLILQGTLLHKDLYTTQQMIDDTREKGKQLSTANNYKAFIMLK